MKYIDMFSGIYFAIQLEYDVQDTS